MFRNVQTLRIAGDILISQPFYNFDLLAVIRVFCFVSVLPTDF